MKGARFLQYKQKKYCFFLYTTYLTVLKYQRDLVTILVKYICFGVDFNKLSNADTLVNQKSNSVWIKVQITTADKT